MFSPTEHGVCLLFFNNLQDSLKFAFFFFKCGCNEFLKKQKKHPQEILLTPLSLEMVGQWLQTPCWLSRGQRGGQRGKGSKKESR